MQFQRLNCDISVFKYGCKLCLFPTTRVSIHVSASSRLGHRAAIQVHSSSEARHHRQDPECGVVEEVCHVFNINLGNFYDAFIQSEKQLCMHTFTHRRRCQRWRATASSSVAVSVRCLAQGHRPPSGCPTLRLPANPLYLLSHMPLIFYS